uniref:Uncharacterized protein n=1 Tax=Solanum tuberosum TaxID=4113 RepID=M1AN27_SOLTU
MSCYYNSPLDRKSQHVTTVIKKTKMTATNVLTTSFPISPFVVPAAYVNIHSVFAIWPSAISTFINM